MSCSASARRPSPSSARAMSKGAADAGMGEKVTEPANRPPANGKTTALLLRPPLERRNIGDLLWTEGMPVDSLWALGLLAADDAPGVATAELSAFPRCSTILTC